MIIDGLITLISVHPHITLTGAYRSGAELLEGLQEVLPDVLLLDIQLPDKNGDELSAIILKKYPGLRILTLTNFDSALYAANMMRQGAKGYLLKTADKQVIIDAIESVYKGGEYLDPVMKEKMDHADLRVRRTFSSRFTLTAREKEILQMIVNGDTCPEISEKLFLSVHTVENYRDNILLKLDVRNTAALVSKALKEGLAQ